MDLKETLAISGHSGLYKFVSQGRNGIVVESFTDKKRSFVPATTKVSSLEDIAIYTNEKEIPLQEVFKSIFEKEEGGKTIDARAATPDDLKKYMEKILPDYDRERVYVSDIKKLFIWYNILHELNLLVFEDEEKVVEETPDGKQDALQESDTADTGSLKEKPKKVKSAPANKKTEKADKTKTSKAPKKGKNPVKK
ncbi:MAG: DUF5606 domain-containing protein [Bacteroidales bacterium]|nr:DUF5606 domain-containing protein [Bacteroidales bacterium]